MPRLLFELSEKSEKICKNFARFRCKVAEILSEKIGSSRKSQHCRGQAADFECYGVDNRELFDWITQNLEFDQAILEFYDGDANSGWLHVSYNEDGNRKQTLRAFRNDAGKTQYEEI